MAPISARSFIKRAKQAPRAPGSVSKGPKEFLRSHSLRVQQPIPLPFQHFIANHLAGSSFIVRRIARDFDPAWTACLRADRGAARRGRQAVRRGIISTLRALGCTQIEIDLLLVDRRRCMFDVCFMYDGGNEGAVMFRSGRATYRIAKPMPEITKAPAAQSCGLEYSRTGLDGIGG